MMTRGQAVPGHRHHGGLSVSSRRVTRVIERLGKTSDRLNAHTLSQPVSSIRTEFAERVTSIIFSKGH